MVNLDFVPDIGWFGTAPWTRHACIIDCDEEINGSIGDQRLSELERRVSTKAVPYDHEFIRCGQRVGKPCSRRFLVPRKDLSIQCSGILLELLIERLKTFASLSGE